MGTEYNISAIRGNLQQIAVDIDKEGKPNFIDTENEIKLFKEAAKQAVVLGTVTKDDYKTVFGCEIHTSNNSQTIKSKQDELKAKLAKLQQEKKQIIKKYDTNAGKTALVGGCAGVLTSLGIIAKNCKGALTEAIKGSISAISITGLMGLAVGWTGVVLGYGAYSLYRDIKGDYKQDLQEINAKILEVQQELDFINSSYLA